MDEYDAEAIKRVIATVPHMVGDLTFQVASPTTSSHSPRFDIQKGQNQSNDDLMEESSLHSPDTLDADVKTAVKQESLNLSKNSSRDESTSASVDECNSSLAMSCTDNSPQKDEACERVNANEEIVIPKQDLDVSLSSSQDSGLLNLSKSDVSSENGNLDTAKKQEGQQIVNKEDFRKMLIGTSDSLSSISFTSTSTEPGRKSKSESCRPSLSEVISNLSHDLHAETSIFTELMPSNMSSVTQSSTSLFEKTISLQSGLKTDKSSIETNSTKVGLDPKDTYQLLKNAKKHLLPSNSKTSISDSSLLAAVPSSMTSFNNSNPTSQHSSSSSSRRRFRKAPALERTDNSSTTQSVQTSPIHNLTPSSAKLSSNVNNTTSSPLFPGMLGYEKFGMLPAIYDYNLPDRGLSTANAAAAAAIGTTRFLPPQVAASQPFMMSYFPLQPVWGGSAATLSITPPSNLNVPSPLDLSSSSKDKKSPEAEKTSEGITSPSQNKESSIKLTNSSNQQHLVKEITKRVSRSSNSRQLKGQTRSTVEKILCAKSSEKELDSSKFISSNLKSFKEKPAFQASQDEDEVQTKPKYEKNLLLFGEQEIEIMSVGKLRWVVRNEADLLRIAQAHLKTNSVCDSASVNLDDNAAVHSSSGDGVSSGLKSDRSDCPVSSSVRREEIEQEETIHGLTHSSSQQQALNVFDSKKEDKDLSNFSSPPVCKKPKLCSSQLSPCQASISDSATKAPLTSNEEVFPATNLPNFLIDPAACSAVSSNSDTPLELVNPVVTSNTNTLQLTPYTLTSSSTASEVPNSPSSLSVSSSALQMKSTDNVSMFENFKKTCSASFESKCKVGEDETLPNSKTLVKTCESDVICTELSRSEIELHITNCSANDGNLPKENSLLTSMLKSSP